MARKFIFALGIAALSLTAAACNTVKGLGRDIESVGEAGDRAI
ncbi:MAG: Entericidin EcnA/B family protein [Erythrobacter sp. 34-65-8]|nr:MAG: Entericidin EcnA/B family protein [Erythrobacter sp. 34-65-8]